MKDNMKKAHYRCIPSYFNPETNELIGRNWFWDILVGINVWFDFMILEIEELPIWIEVDEN